MPQLDDNEWAELQRLRAENEELRGRVPDREADDRDEAPVVEHSPDPYAVARANADKARREGLSERKVFGDYVRTIFEEAARGNPRVLVKERGLLERE